MMKNALFNSGLFVFGNLCLAFCWSLDKLRGTTHPRFTEHDRFADRAVYSRNQRVDPLAIR